VELASTAKNPIGAGGGVGESSAAGASEPPAADTYVPDSGLSAGGRVFIDPNHVLEGDVGQEQLYAAFIPQRVEACSRTASGLPASST
jgi:hypothetical protein